MYALIHLSLSFTGARRKALADMEIPDGLHYTDEHSWARIDGDTAVVGITEYAQDKLGEVVYVDVPEPATEVRHMVPFGTIESSKTSSDLWAPLSGEVIETNSELLENPALVNSSPYGEGWLIKIRIADHGDIEKLLSATQYKAVCQ